MSICGRPADIIRARRPSLISQGTVRAEQRPGPLAAPTDLEPKRLEFHLGPIPPDVKGRQVVVDPAGEVSELFEENNSVEI